MSEIETNEKKTNETSFSCVYVSASEFRSRLCIRLRGPVSRRLRKCRECWAVRRLALFELQLVLYGHCGRRGSFSHHLKCKPHVLEHKVL